MMYYAHIAVEPRTSANRQQTCAAHARAVASLARNNLAAAGLGSMGELAGLLHDCGKFTDEFNDYLERASRGEKVAKGSVIHTFAGVRYLLERFHSPDGSRPFSDLAAEVLAAGVASHHGLVDLWDERHQSGFDHRLHHQPAYDRRAMEAFHAQCADGQEIECLFRQAEQEMKQFYMQKIGACVSSEAEVHFALGLLMRLITSAVVDADRTDTRCFMEGLALPQTAPVSWEACAARIDAYVASFPQATPIQRARRVFSDSCAAAAEMSPGLYRLDLPTGGGKTLAALRFAVLHARKHRMQRVFYIAPLLSIIEQNAEVIRKAVGDSLPVLEHHSNLLRENLTAEEAKQTELLQETWDAPLIVTTLVQLLETLFSGKMAAVRRFHCLSGSVVIIDEVQSLPPRLLSLFNCAVNFLARCCGATIVLCSATQPAFDSQTVRHRMLSPARLISDALFDQYAPLFCRTSIKDAGAYTMAELAAAAVSALDESASLLIVCNTKREAAELYRLLADMADARLFHLSAGMCMAHRKQTLTEMTSALQAGERLICVSTQVIEAGVDISFGAVMRLSAGLDSIVQAAGRCNRHGEHDAPQPVRICRLKEENLGPLREIREAQNALNVLLEEYRRAPERYGGDLTSAAAVRAYYAHLYSAMPVGYQDDCTHGHTLFELLTTNDQYIPERGSRYHLNQAFRTAGDWFEVFDSANESLLVPFEDGAEIIAQLADDCIRYDSARLRELLTKAKPYTVSVTAAQLERMLHSGTAYTLLDGSIYVLNDGCYDSRTGIKEGNDSCSTLIL